MDIRLLKIITRLKANIHTMGLTIILLVFIFSCTERIELDLDSTYTRLVVEGTFTSDTGIHRVRLSTSTDFYNKNRPPAVSEAQVSISSGNATFEMSENPTGSGVYETVDGVFGIAGNDYSLHISLKEPIGGYSIYRATSLLRPTNQPDSIRIVYQPQWGEGFWEIKLYAYDPPTNDFYKFLIYKNEDLLSDSLNKIVVVDDRLFNGSYTNGIGVGFLNAQKPREIVNPYDTITLMIANLTEDHARFMTTARTESGFNSPLFSGPPANIIGNISNGAIGYFAAYQPRYAAAVYKP